MDGELILQRNGGLGINEDDIVNFRKIEEAHEKKVIERIPILQCSSVLRHPPFRFDILVVNRDFLPP